MDTFNATSQTFGQDRQIASFFFPAWALGGGPWNPGGPWNTECNGGAIPAVNLASPNEVYIIYAAAVGSDPADVFVLRSTDGGANWSGPVGPINDDFSGQPQILPTIAVEPSTGHVYAVWYDHRSFTGWDLYIAKSTDKGATWRNARFSDRQITVMPNPPGYTYLWLGEYLGLAVDSANAYVVWTGYDPGSASTRLDVLLDVIPTASW